MPTPATPRTTDALVRGIVQVQGGVDLTPFIRIANQLTTDQCTYPKTGQDPAVFLPYEDGFEESKMELIERWLAAHFYTVFDNQLSSAKAGTINVGFQHKIDMGLKCSMYGQQAMLLDNYGSLAAWDNTAKTKRQIKVSISWLGEEVETTWNE